ncbi:hypothetical protein L1049_017915 [Liquidambar formosana]|uniref:AAA+ ATPase domain-containing protein n=1 Tax=Liquidambar formosana TaxID=63359 RepID=A0AAP0NHL3_LIQFO
MLKEVERLLKDGSFPDGIVAMSHLLETVKYIPGPSIEHQTTASNTLAKTMNLLREDRVKRIGIWGMGGVGKTTLVKNLNNKLRCTTSTQPFGRVIWVTVSKELDLKRVQTQIAGRLRFPISLEESEEGLASQLYERLMKEKKFLLILDDVWETIDLDSLGVPQPEIHTGFKIIVTSRSLSVCEGMKADVKVKVDVLDNEEAWQLFSKSTGSVASLEHVKPFAKAVARECSGLPLAIIIVGTAIRGKAMVELWKNALNELRWSEPPIEGIENKVDNPLKWSYDSLHCRNTKPRFLYCSLFPEDYSIQVSKLVQFWMADGLIDEELNYEDSLNRGITVVENMKDLFLLEPGFREGTVKMHDVVRDVAIWIALSLEDGCMSLVQSGIGLSQISQVKLLKSCKRISFMNNKIKSPPDCVIQCPNTSTLLLQGKFPLEKVLESFLLGLQLLRVLNMSETRIQTLPLTLSQLCELRALVLRDCSYLEELPPLGGLRKLQVLDLVPLKSGNFLKGWKNWTNLRQLNLSLMGYPKTIQAGVVSRWSSLEVLDMSQSCYKWGVKGDVEEGQAMFEELRCLGQLTVVHIQLHSMPYHGSEDPTWIERWRIFQIFVGLSFCVRISTTSNLRTVNIKNFDLSKNRIRWLLINANDLYLESCTEIGRMFEDLVTNSGGIAGLKSLNIVECDILGPFRGCAARHDLLPNLEQLHLHGIRNLECFQPLVVPLGLRFSRLRIIEVWWCLKLKYLIPHDLIPYLINLEEIKVWFCENFENLFEYSSRAGQNVASDLVVPKLRILVLEDLPELRSICREKESWQSIELVDVRGCDQLRRLPLTTQNANTIKEIRGQRKWWSELEWDDDHTKLTFRPFFNLSGKTTLVKKLNNKLRSTSSTQPFGRVIWVTVSKELDLKRVRTQIAGRLRFPLSLEESEEGLASQLYERLMKEKKFLLILDDVWETIDLDSLGVPQPEIHTGFKIIVTSRSLSVCEGMKADVKVKVDVLDNEEAWQLFSKSTGSVASLEHVKPFAKAVARECSGLPLAIIIVGTAMRGKAMVELWKNALNELRRSEAHIEGIENKVYNPLKWSYDSLHGRNTKPCFLYCSLFPEDYSIPVSELVQFWMANGLIDEELNYEDSLNRGITVVENLKDLCLLEPGFGEGTVKMHDVVRDVAVWIAFSLEDGCKSLVQSGIGLSQISQVELLKSCRRISFMNNKIKSLPDCVIQCPNTSTLLQELPPLGGLRKLQVLDLGATKIRQFPKGMEELTNLRQLNLSLTGYRKTIQAGVVSRWSSLEVLDMSQSCYKWGVKGDVEEGQAMFEELRCLRQLTVVHIQLHSMPYHGSEDPTWIERWRILQIFVGLSFCVRISTTSNLRTVNIRNFDLSKNRIRWLLINANDLYLESCTEIGRMFEDLVTNSEGIAGLKSLNIVECDILGPFRGCAARHELLPNLEQLHLYGIRNLECFQPLVVPIGLRFSRLRIIEVWWCLKLKYLIPHDLIPYLINLEEIKVWFCENFENLFEYSSRSGPNVAADPVVPKLRILVLEDLPELRSICREKESWQSIELVDVRGCQT